MLVGIAQIKDSKSRRPAAINLKKRGSYFLPYRHWAESLGLPYSGPRNPTMPINVNAAVNTRTSFVFSVSGENLRYLTRSIITR